MAAITSLGLASAAQAQPEGSDAAQLLAQAIEEQRVIHSCFSLLPTSLSAVESLWARMKADSLPLLVQIDPTGALARRLEDEGRLEALLPEADTPFSELQALCHGAERLEQRVARLELIQLTRELELLVPD